ncbi:hypothetical protein [Crocinitomix algicola]|uniref:hypothetical protein n=1 Tax=Crocinitomix algicola TaxID=1740263 RepID=UPI000831F990|nr:hypothetical protein [Crocinitomix algicola]
MTKAKPIDLQENQLHKIAFQNADALPSKLKRNQRNKALIKAASMNLKSACKITFESKYHGLLSITAPILMAGDAFVVLKGGKLIPKHSIVSVKH